MNDFIVLLADAVLSFLYVEPAALLHIFFHVFPSYCFNSVLLLMYFVVPSTKHFKN